MSERSRELTIKIEAEEVNVGKEITFLGVTIECNMAFNMQVEKIIRKMKKRANILSALAGKGWCWEWRSLRTI